MSNVLTSVLLLAGALGSGLVGGIFFAFSTFIMRAFDRLPPGQAIAAMQSINVTVINPLFFLAFFGTALVSLLLLLAGFLRHDETSALIMIGAGVYLAGSILVTIVFNVPLNDRLAPLSLQAADMAPQWRDYAARWTVWNHVRTMASLAASGAFMWAVRLLP